AAAGVMLLLGAVRRRLGPVAVWVLVWGGYLLPLAIVALVTGRDLLMPTLQAVLGLAVGIFAFVDRPRMLTLGIAVALVVSAGAGLVERELSRRLWWDSSTPMGVSHLVSGVSELSGD